MLIENRKTLILPPTFYCFYRLQRIGNYGVNQSIGAATVHFENRDRLGQHKTNYVLNFKQLFK